MSLGHHTVMAVFDETAVLDAVTHHPLVRLSLRQSLSLTYPLCPTQ